MNKPMEWHEAQALVDALDEGARQTLFALLSSPAGVRSQGVARLYGLPGGAPLAELLIELEDKEWARQWFVERLR